MLEALHVTDSPAMLAAVIRFKIPQMELPSVMGPAVGELLATLKAQGLTPAGPLFNHYLSMEGGLFDFEVGVPVSTPVAPAGRVVPGELPAAKVVRPLIKGPTPAFITPGASLESSPRERGISPRGAFGKATCMARSRTPIRRHGGRN